jgi:hypothetical protein
MQRGYARDARDEKRLVAAGVPARSIYREDRGAEQWGKWKMRAGETLAIVDGLHAFGKTRKGMMAALDLVESWGAVIVDVESGLRSDKNSAKLLDLGLRKRHGELAMVPGQAESMQEASVLARLRGRMPFRSAKVRWMNPELTTKQALKQMRGWSQGTAYRAFGKRGTPPGRPTL